MLTTAVALCVAPICVAVLVACVAAGVWMSMRGGIINRERKVAAWYRRTEVIAGNHTEVAGVLSGFSITVVVLIAGSTKGSLLLHDIGLGTFVVAFFGYIATGLLFSLVPERTGTHRSFLFAQASMLYFLAVLLGFIGLMPFLELVGYELLKAGLFVLIAGAFVAGYLAASIPLFDLLRFRRKFLALMFVAAIAGSCLWITITYALLFITDGGAVGAVMTLSLVIPILVIVFSFAVPMMTFFSSRLAHSIIFVAVSIVTAIACTFSTLQVFSTILLLGAWDH